MLQSKIKNRNKAMWDPGTGITPIRKNSMRGIEKRLIGSWSKIYSAKCYLKINHSADAHTKSNVLKCACLNESKMNY